MEFPKLENAEQARVLGLMMSERGLEMLTAEHDLMIRQLQDAGEHGDEEIENRLHLVTLAMTECVRILGPAIRFEQYNTLRRANVYKLRPDVQGQTIDQRG